MSGGGPTPSAIERRVRAMEAEMRRLRDEVTRVRIERHAHVRMPRIKLWRFRLNERMGYQEEGEAEAELIALDGETTDPATTVQILDPSGLFEFLLEDDEGLALQFAGEFYAVQALPVAYVFKTPSGGIPAATESEGVRTLGSAICDAYRLVEDGEIEGVFATEAVAGHAQRVYNMMLEAVAGSVFIQAKRESSSGILLVDVEECED